MDDYLNELLRSASKTGERVNNKRLRNVFFCSGNKQKNRNWDFVFVLSSFS